MARRLRQHHLKGRTITVKIRDLHFKTITRRTTILEPTDFEETIYREAVALAEQAQWGLNKVRLIGVNVSGFSRTEPVQLDLFASSAPQTDPDLEKLHQTVDQLKDRFGDQIITKGTIIRVKREVERQD